MLNLTDQSIYDILATLVTVVAVAYVLVLLVRVLGRTRQDLRIGTPVLVGLGIRTLAAAGISALPVASSLRGGDEPGIITVSQQVAATPFGSGDWTDALTAKLHVFETALQAGLLDPPDMALRVTQAGIALAGIVLLATAVYELAGPRAATLAAWLLAFEPSSIFFSSIVHKESTMLLAVGLVAFGGAMMWKRADFRSLLPMAAGCLVALATRPYAAWFLIAAAAAITLHAGMRSQRQGSSRGLPLVASVVLLIAVALPTVLEASTEENLERLQSSQTANATDEANLSLEEVDFSSREAIVTNLPQRIRDVLFRPYPWQLESTSQRFAVVGTLFALVAMGFLVAAIRRNWGAVMARVGPLVYLGFFVLIAYSLSAGNAGTAFRYRTHVVAVGLCLLTALWELGRRDSPDKSASAPPIDLDTDREPALSR